MKICRKVQEQMCDGTQSSEGQGIGVTEEENLPKTQQPLWSTGAGCPGLTRCRLGGLSQSSPW